MRSPNKPRVIRVNSSRATFWDYKTKPYVNFINDEVVYRMINTGLCELTGTSSLKQAWQRLMPSYRKGDKIAIKPNLNALHLGYEKNITTTPSVINSVTRSLINEFDVSPSKIYVYDLCVGADNIKSILKHPVNCIGKSENGSFLENIKMRTHIGLNASDTSAPVEMKHPLYDTDGRKVYCYIPKVVTQAEHLINIPVLKAHQFVLTTCAFKNHLGTIRFSNYNQYPVILHGDNLQSHLLDIYMNKHIKDKTRLIIVDALFAAPLYSHEPFGRLPTQWHSHLKNKLPNSIFLSVDPIAVESIIVDYVSTEQSYMRYELLPHDYLHMAAEKNLGVHEHCKDDGSYELIDYKEISI